MVKIDENIFSWANKFITWFEKDSYFPLRPDFSEDGKEFIAQHEETHNDEDYVIEIHVFKTECASDSD